MARALTKGKTIGVQLPLGLDAEVRAEAAESGTSIGRFVTAIVIDHYRREHDDDRRAADPSETAGVGAVALAPAGDGDGGEGVRASRVGLRSASRGVAALRAECHHPAFVARHGIVICAYCRAPRE